MKLVEIALGRGVGMKISQLVAGDSRRRFARGVLKMWASEAKDVFLNRKHNSNTKMNKKQKNMC